MSAGRQLAFDFALEQVDVKVGDIVRIPHDTALWRVSYFLDALRHPQGRVALIEVEPRDHGSEYGVCILGTNRDLSELRT